MSIADFFHGLGEIAVAGLCDFATERLGLEKPDEGSYLSQLYEEEQKHAGNILQHLSGDKLFRLQPGTPVYCNLAGGLAEHSGICIGRKIVHLDGSGNVICTSPKTFIERKSGSNFAFNIYYAAKRENSPLGNAEIARRAQARVGKHQTYSVWTDNCHGFTLGCITGNFDQHHNYRLGEIANAISEYYGTDDWEWRAWDFDNV